MPKSTFVIPPTVRKVTYSFIRAFSATALLGLTGLSVFPDWETARAFGAAVLVGALTAGFRAAQEALTSEPVKKALVRPKK